MSRVVILIILLFGPLVTYWAYLSFVMRRKAESGGAWNEMPVAALLVAGLVLMMGALVYTALTGGAEPGTAYEPSRVEDGVLVPGEIVPQRDRSDGAIEDPE